MFEVTKRLKVTTLTPSRSTTVDANQSLSVAVQGDVFFYYGLRNFHQNLRRYMDSRDDAQTAGRKNHLQVASTERLR